MTTMSSTLPPVSGMRQLAPYPEELAQLVMRLLYKPLWHITLEDLDRGQGSRGLTLCVLITTPDTYDVTVMRRVMHYHIVPAAAYDRRSWQKWLFDRLMDIELHEAMEYFQIDGRRPFAPNHGPGRDPYQLMEIGLVEDAKTSFRGVRAEGTQA